MSVGEFFTQYGTQIFTLVLDALIFLFVCLTRRMMANAKNNCIMNLTSKKESIDLSTKKIYAELESARNELKCIKEENEAIRQKMNGIENAILHFSEINGEEENDRAE